MTSTLAGTLRFDFPGPFGRFREGCDIVAKSSSPARTALLIGGILHMVSNYQLPLFLWREALKKDCYVHTKLSSKERKAVPKTPLEI